MYYRFNDYRFSVDAGYPRLTNYWWLGCRTGFLQEELISNDTEEQMEESNHDDQFVEVMNTHDEEEDPPASGQSSMQVAVSLVISLLLMHWFM